MSSFIIGLVIGAVIGTVFGILFGRKNKKIADKLHQAANTVAAKAEDAVEKKSS